jgi:hypothetical protein
MKKSEGMEEMKGNNVYFGISSKIETNLEIKIREENKF